MAILKIAHMGHPVLRKVAVPVEVPLSDDMYRLTEDMIETMQDSGGTGLAAPQVHVSSRILVYYVSEGRIEEGEDPVPLTVLINPVLTFSGDEITYDWEGCLSVPGLTGLVPRYNHVQLQATLPDGSVIDKEVRGFHARVLQHEYDHLDGILYPQRMDDLSLLMFTEEIRHGLPDRAAELMKKGYETG